MGSKKRWPQELADRCNAVGWNARIVGNGHFKADLPDGTTMSWAASPSDRHGEKAALRIANNHGLSRLETEMRLQKEKERLERIAQDRELNGVPEHQMTSAKQAPEPKKEANAMESAKAEKPKYGYIEMDGMKIGIAEIAKPVMHRHPRGGEPYPLPHARELLLVDDTIRYQCLKLVKGDEICARHFKTSGGLVVHWARGVHADQPDPAQRDLGGVLPVEPAPEPDLETAKRAILADTKPVRVTTSPAPEPAKAEPVPTAPPTGVMARMEDLGNQVLDIHYEAQRLANHAQDVHAAMVKLAQDLPQELSDEETRQKAELLDQMRGLLK